MVVFRRHTCIVSHAWCPAKTKCCVSVSRTAQLRRSLQLFIEGHLQIVLLKRKKRVSTQHIWLAQPAPETPMPEEPLVRVLETFDLSATNVEHFLDPKTDLKALVLTSGSDMLQEHV